MDETRVEREAERIVAENIDAWGWGPLDEIEGLSEHVLAVKAVKAGLLTRPTDPGEDKVEVVAPIDMMLFCPKCGLQHIDAPDERTPDWTNPPHRSHLCHGCGCIWRPADVPTNGVAAIQTRGSKDTVFYNSAAIAAMGHTPPSGEDG
jgi:hypothetical protein